jgi:predicted GIY-YIG superfamily endonuclease
MVPQLPAADADTPTSVYTYYDRHNILLYVGVTSRGMQRNREHNQTKSWWTFVARQEVEHFPTRGKALVQESRLIQQFRPPFNTQGNPGYLGTRAAYLAFHEAASRYPAGVNEMQALGKILPMRQLSQSADGCETILLSTVAVNMQSVGVKPGSRAVSKHKKYGVVEAAWMHGPFVAVRLTGRMPAVETAEARLKWRTKERRIDLANIVVETVGDVS